MTENEYNQHADAALSAIECVLESHCDDLDFDSPGAGILEISFDDGSRIIINKQSAVQELWVAARSGGYHFRWMDGSWRDTRTGVELMATLTDLVREQSGGCCEVS